MTSPIHKAIEDTRLAYKRLIADPEGEVHKWSRFGRAPACRFCTVVEDQCQLCPLGPGDTACVDDTDDVNGTYSDFADALRVEEGDYEGEPYDFDEIRVAAKARLAWIEVKVNEWSGRKESQ